MARPMPVPQAFPRQIITLLSILMAVLVLAFPSSPRVVLTLVLLGGAVFFFLNSKASKQGVIEVEMQPVEAAIQAAMTKQDMQDRQSPPKQTAAKEGAVKAAESAKPVEIELTHMEPSSKAADKAGAEKAVVPAHPSEDGKLDALSKQAIANGHSKESETSSAKSEKTTRPGREAGARPKHDATVQEQTLQNETVRNVASKQSKPANATAAPLAGGAAVLARLRQQRAAKAQPKAEATKEVIVAYASQTGTAHEIAKAIQAESASHGIKSQVASLNEVGFEALAGKKSPVLIVIAASTGDGDAPDNAAKFYATMRRRTQEGGILAGVKFTCLGLGDSNYTRFMGVSRSIRTRLQELGAEPFYKMGEADEVDGLETVVDSWTAGLWKPLKAIVTDSKDPPSLSNGDAKKGSAADATKADGLEGVPALLPCQIGLRWIGDATETSRAANGACINGAENLEGVEEIDWPFWAPITSAKYLTAATSEKKVLHLELSLKESRLEYQPGDSVSIMPENEDSLVNTLQQRLGVRGEDTFHITSLDGKDEPKKLSHIARPSTVRQALQRCDITSAPRKSLLRILGEHCSDAKDKHELLHLSSRGGRQDYSSLISPVSPTLLDLLQRYPSCHPPLPALLDALPPLPPRLYSISSSPAEYPGCPHIALTVVQIGSPAPNVSSANAAHSCSKELNGRASGKKDILDRWGVASGWLERKVDPLLAGRLAVDIKVMVRLRRGGTFGYPADLSAPVLMIGPGTGVCPFRGFLQHRRQVLLKAHQGAVGPAVLYFGCRSSSEDFLYEADLKKFADDGTLTKLELAFSREGGKKIYVQHTMKEQGKSLAPMLLDSKSFIFICGDGANMAKDVHATLLGILEEHGNMSASQAASHLSSLSKSGRYVRDIWSS